MGYMSRLGIWGKGTQFDDFLDFLKAVERRGVGAMELVAMDMKVGTSVNTQPVWHPFCCLCTCAAAWCIHCPPT